MTAPPPGFYTDPHDPTVSRWWDGAQWTDVAQPAAAQPAAAVGAPSATSIPGLARGAAATILPGLTSIANDPAGFYRQHQRGVDTVAGAALVTDGLIGNPLSGVVSGKRTVGGVAGGLFLIVFGVLFGGVAYVAQHMATIPASMSAHAAAKVMSVDWSNSTDSNGHTSHSCKATAAFTVGGVGYSAPSRIGMSPCPWSVGEVVDVRYDPATPSSSAIQTGAESVAWFTWLFVGIGAFVAVAGGFKVVRGVAELGTGIWFLRRGLRRRS